MKIKIKKYNLLITVDYSHHGAGTAMVSHVFGPYDTLEECKEAGNEAEESYTSSYRYLSYSCIPIYVIE